MLPTTLLVAGTLATARAQTPFQNPKDAPEAAQAASADAPDGAHLEYGYGYDYYKEFLETAPGCAHDVEVRLRWDHPADLDLRVEGPDMCKISFANPLSKGGGVLVEDIVPFYCDARDAHYEEVIVFPNGVANGGIYAIDANYFGDGGCRTGPVDFHLSVTMGGKLVGEFGGTLKKPGDTSETYYALGYRSGHDCTFDAYGEQYFYYHADEKKDEKRDRPDGRDRPDDKKARRGDGKDRDGKDRDGKDRRRPDGRGRSLLTDDRRRPDDRRPEPRKPEPPRKPETPRKPEPPRKEHKCECFSGKIVSKRGTCDMGDDDEERPDDRREL